MNKIPELWSYSQYSSLAKCPKHFELRYLKEEKPDYLSSDLEFGTALHEAVAACLHDQEASLIFEFLWLQAKEKNLEYSRFGWEQLNSMGLKFIDKFNRLHKKKYTEIIANEKRLYSKKYWIEGTPDYVGFYDGKKAIRDFKTSGYRYESDKKHCALQLNLYALLAIDQLGFTPETLGYTVFCKGTESIQDLTWEFDKEEALRQLEDIETVIDLSPINVGLFPKNLNSCLYPKKCEFFSKCHGG